MIPDDHPSRDPDIPGVAVLPIPDNAPRLRITLDAPARRLGPEIRRRIDQRWSEHAARNPRLFDGPILSCAEADPEHAILRCRRASYRELICRPEIDTGVMQVSVTGVVLAATRGGTRLLLARRGPGTRIYPGMWELAPSGGLDPPTPVASDDPREHTGDDAWRQLVSEAREELGLPIPGDQPRRPRCLAIDTIAHSIDIVFTITLDGPSAAAAIEARHEQNWEYTQTAWIDTAALPEFDAASASGIIPPTRALLRFFGWVPHSMP